MAKRISKISTEIFIIVLIIITLANAAYSQSTYQNLGEKSRTAVDKTKNAVCDSLGPVNKAIHQTEKVAKDVWEKSEPARKEATKKVKAYLKETEPARKAAIDNASKYLDSAVQKSKEAAKEFKEGWDKGAKK
jgi:predicted Holliday junction resolvase-like endonuclease